MINWKDLRYVQVIARTKGIAKAAKELRVHQSTVFRRLNTLEKELGVLLFERTPTGYIATPVGEEFCQTAEQIEEDLTALNRRVIGNDMLPKGNIRVTTTDGLLSKLLTSCFIAFQNAYPEINLEVIVSSETINLNKRDADVAIRMAKYPLETLVGRRVSKIATAIYGSKDYLSANPAVNNLSDYCWIGSDENSADLASIRWLKHSFPEINFRYRANTCMGMLTAVKENFGLATLFCFLADSEPTLRRVHPPIPELEKDLWVLTHPDLRYVVRIRTFIDFIASALSQKIDLLEGEQKKVREMALNDLVSETNPLYTGSE